LPYIPLHNGSMGVGLESVNNDLLDKHDKNCQISARPLHRRFFTICTVHPTQCRLAGTTTTPTACIPFTGNTPPKLSMLTRLRMPEKALSKHEREKNN
jgi:hypothetical protein